MKAHTYEQVNDWGSDAIEGALWLLDHDHSSEAHRVLASAQSAMEARKMEIRDMHQAQLRVHEERLSGPLRPSVDPR
jgi:hypothetical protein